MNHDHTFHERPSKEGFEGLGRKESNKYDGELIDTVFYMLRDCTDENCSVQEYRSWLFDINSVDACCEQVYPDEAFESMDPSLIDFQSLEDPITLELTCNYCGNTQIISSDHIYRNLV